MRRGDETITKDEAIQAVRDASWAKTVATCGHRGCEEHEGDSEERYIHSVLGGLGADHTLTGAIDLITKATRVGWSDHIMSHDLVVVTPEHKIYRYEVRRPDEVADAHP